MNKAIFIVFLIALVGCRSTGVVPTGGGVYIISKKSTGGAFSDGNDAKADLYKEANLYCDSRNLSLETVEATSKGGIPFVRMGSAELKFKCVDKAD